LKPNTSDSLALAALCCRALDEKKAEDLKVIDVSALSSITNYLVIGTATSEPHVRALRVELEKVLDASHTRIVGMEASGEGGWTVMDAFDVMVHIFLPETRKRYRLEHLWRDGDEVAVQGLLHPEAPRPARAARKKAPASKRAKPAPKKAKRK
jgi:ribosome-associated protein